MKTTTKNIGLYKIGTVFCIEVTDIKNTGTEAIPNTEVAVTVPDGVTYSTGNYPQGAYDTGSDKWLVGTLLAGANLTATFCFEVTDDTKGPYSFVFTISSDDTCADCDSNRQFCVIVEGTACADVQTCSECVEDEQFAYNEGEDAVYKRCLYYTHDFISNGNLELTELPITTTDVIKYWGSIKYDDFPVTVRPIDTILEGDTYWEISDSSSFLPEAAPIAVRLTIYYKKQAATAG